MHACTNHSDCSHDALARAEALCAAQGVRFTSLRRRVLEMIWQKHQPSKAYDILDSLQKEDPSAKPPTVYRTLDFLVENGLVHKLSSLNAFVGCSHPQAHTECYFFICTGCGEIEECCSEALSAEIQKHVKARAFRAQRTTLEIAGLCEGCATDTPQ